MTSSVKKNYLYNLAYQVLAIIVPIITTPYVSRVLGPSGIGVFNYTNGIVLYFSIFALTGTNTFGQREIARYQSNAFERSKLFWEIFIFRFICTFIVFLAYLFFIFNFLLQYRVLFYINFLMILSWIFDISWFFQGIEDFKTTAIRNSVVKILGTVLIFVFVNAENDVWLYSLIYVGTMLLGNLSMWIKLWSNLDRVQLKTLRVLSHFKPIMGLFFPVIAVQIYTLLNKTMLGGMFNSAEVGYYSQADRIVQLLLTIVSSVVAVLLPRFTVLYRNRNFEKINHYYHKTIDYIFVLALPLCLGCIAVSDLFVPIFFGPGYDSVIGNMRIQSFLLLVVSIGQFLGTYLVAINKQNKYTIAVTVTAICNLLFNFILIHSYGSIGASISTVLSEIIATVLQLFFLCRELNISYILKSFIHYLIPSILMFCIIYLVRLIPVMNIFSLVLSVFTSSLFYISYLVLMRDKFIISILRSTPLKAFIKLPKHI